MFFTMAAIGHMLDIYFCTPGDETKDVATKIHCKSRFHEIKVLLRKCNSCQ